MAGTKRSKKFKFQNPNVKGMPNNSIPKHFSIKLLSFELWISFELWALTFAISSLQLRI
jgi:hypothetical protein